MTVDGFGHLAGVGVCANRLKQKQGCLVCFSTYLLKRKDEEELPLMLAQFSMGEWRNPPTRLSVLVLPSRLPRPSSPTTDEEEREVDGGGSERLPFKSPSPALGTREGAR